MPAKKKKRATVLVLRTCQSDLTSHGGFRWPEAGAVECQDWQPTKNCGHGLHGLAWGVGDGSLLNYDDDAKWLVVEADADSIVEIDWGKIKFPRGTVVHCGDQRSATDYLLAHGAAGKPVVGALSSSGYGGKSTSGNEGTSTSGDAGILSIRWWDGGRYRVTLAYVGEGGVKPNTPYRCDERGRLVEVEKVAAK